MEHCICSRCMGGHLFRAALFHAAVHTGRRTDPGRNPGDEDIFLRNLYDGAAVCRTVYLCGTQPSETGSILFTSEKSDHRGAADDPPPNDRRTRHRRRVPRRAGVKCARRNCMLRDHAHHSVACAEGGEGRNLSISNCKKRRPPDGSGRLDRSLYSQIKQVNLQLLLNEQSFWKQCSCDKHPCFLP